MQEIRNEHKYDDILYSPRHIPSTRPNMPIINRAAQFAPFAALSGYEEAVIETARVTDDKRQLDDLEKFMLDSKLQRLLEMKEQQPEISVTFFEPDSRKVGGAYITVTGTVKKVYPQEGFLIMSDGRKILAEAIHAIDSKIFLRSETGELS